MTADITGNLEVLDLMTLMQIVAQEKDQTLIRLEHGAQVGHIYVNNGQLCHAELPGSNGESPLTSEEVIYELLSWEKGQFEVIKHVQSPTVSIDLNWDFLLMEGMRRIDEKRRTHAFEPTDDELLFTILAGMSDEDAAQIKKLVNQNKEINMANVQQTLQAIMAIDGAIACALVDWESGLTLGTAGSGLDIELAAAGNTNVVRSKLAVMKDLKLKGGVEDILITLTEQYHLIRILESNPHLFLYVALSRGHANLGMARHKLMAIEKELDM